MAVFDVLGGKGGVYGVEHWGGFYVRAGNDMILRDGFVLALDWEEEV